MASKSKFYYTLLGFLTITHLGNQRNFYQKPGVLGWGQYLSRTGQSDRWYRGVGYATDQERGTDRYP